MSTCVQSTIDVKADKRYEREVAGNIAISVGVGMIILFVTICINLFLTNCIYSLFLKQTFYFQIFSFFFYNKFSISKLN